MEVKKPLIIEFSDILTCNNTLHIWKLGWLRGLKIYSHKKYKWHKQTELCNCLTQMENNCLFSNYRPVTLTTLSNKKYFLRFRFTKCSNDHFLVRTRRLTVSILDARWRTRMKLFRDPSFSSPVSRSGWRYWDCSKVGLELEDTRSATLYKRSRKPLKF